MFSLILLLVLGSGLVYISKFNFVPVSVNLGMYVISEVPLFYVMVGSMLIGLIFSYVIYTINSLSNSMALRSKDKEIKVNKYESLELTKRVHQLELENEKIKNGTSTESIDTNAL